METYLVGGAIRDTLLGLPVKDKDWVVVGSTQEEMLCAGYKKVSNSFPIFLHPYSKEEYALARTEKKSKLGGHIGFTCYSSPSVTLKQDLQRRDLTINALAQDNNGRIIDFYHGKKDLKNRSLRHISPAFSDDPLRILRVARFAARYFHLNFHIADETMKLMIRMTNSGELKSLSPDRIWKETESALLTYNPEIYFQVLRDCGALKILFPEVNSLFGIPMIKKQGLKIDTGIHTLMTLNIAATLSEEVDIRFSALCHDFGKSLTLKKFWPKHRGHGMAGVKLIEKLCLRLHIPNKIRDISKLSAEFHDMIHIFPILQPPTIIRLFDKIDAWRKPERIKKISLISEANFREKTNFKNSDYAQKHLLQEAFKIANSVSTNTLIQEGFKGKEIRRELTRRRIQSLKSWKKERAFYYFKNIISN